MIVKWFNDRIGEHPKEDEQTLGNPISQRDEFVFVPPLLLALFNSFYALGLGAEPQVAIAIAAYFFVPIVVLYIGTKHTTYPSLIDAMVFVAMAVVPIVLGKNFGGSATIPTIGISAALEGIWLWKFCRGMSGINFAIPKIRDFGVILLAIIGLVAVLMHLAFLIGFPKPMKELEDTNGIGDIARLMFSQMLSPGFLWMWLRKVAQTAFVEEVAFRGLAMNMLTKRFGFWVAILGSSALFGISHIGHGGWRYVLLSFIAGWVFGFVYKKTNNLIPGMMAHATLDTFTRLLFEMRPV